MFARFLGVAASLLLPSHGHHIQAVVVFETSAFYGIDESIQ